MRHVHFGAGNFGLGFVGCVSKYMHFEFVLANRGSGAQSTLSTQNELIARQQKYEIEYYDGERELIPVSQLLNFSDTAQHGQLIDLILDNETKLVTTSLKGAHIQIIPTLVEALRARATSGSEKVFILACENAVSSEDLRRDIQKSCNSEISEAINGVTEYIQCMVDRVCSEPRIVDDRVVVPAERFGCLVLDPSADVSLFKTRLEHASSQNALIKIASNFDVEITKKKWLLNGPHLILAINALYERKFDFCEYVNENKNLLAEIFQEFSIGCAQSIIERDDLSFDQMIELDKDLQLASETNQQRFLQNPDLVERIASRFLKPTHRSPKRLQDFFSNLSYKVMEPALAFRRRAGQLPHRISLTLYRLVDLVADGRFLKLARKRSSSK
ncbi:hypothetical protein QNJ95_37125 [Bradyrhizobium elkanii]|uniref:hypothetical protein n=1 Tax=Bradyrhizobium elkanii TaxID=29448 RepID=UPI002711F342|nr:hypothetical protein [Bradyrhizobium elkanii]WLA38508.1 hypothetical protein QNJ95_37125 [Bradyrhizobium elkanii]